MRKRRSRRRKPWKLLKRVLVLVVLLAIAVTGVYYVTHKKEPEKESLIQWDDPKLPVVLARVGGSDVNPMYGYVDEMVDRYMRDTVTPLDASGNLKLSVQEVGEKVTDIRYEVRSLDATQLVDKREIKEWETKEQEQGNVLSISLPLQNLLVSGEEYQLKLILTTNQHESIVYYTRVVQSQDFMTNRMLDFVKDFQTKTLDTKKASGMAVYLKENKDSSGSLGYVTLNSTYKQLLWNYMNPEVVGEEQIRIVDINSTIGTFVFRFKVKFTDENKVSHLCDVEETYTVQISNGREYLLIYERTANENLSLEQIDADNSRIKLGIVEDDSVHILNSEERKARVFTYHGKIWLTKQNEQDGISLHELFSFHDESEDLRKLHDEYDVQLVSVNDDGDASFLIYGYMNQGNHEGSVGLAFYQYSFEKNQTKEIFFLPFNRTYAILKQEIGQLAYMNHTDLFFLMLNGNIYAIDFSGKEFMTVVEDVSEDALWVSADKTMIAWGEDLNRLGAGNVHLFSLEEGVQSTITAKKGEALQVIGFIGKDLAVGNVSRAQQDAIRNRRDTVMYSMDIISYDGDVLATYEKENTVLTGAEIENGSVVLKRATLESGVMKAISDDALIENANQSRVEDELLYRRNGSEGYAVWYMSCAMESAPSSVQVVKQYSVGDSSYLNLNLNEIAEDGMFFAYAKGELQGIGTTIAECVNQVYEDIGYVTDSNGYYVMRRGYRNVHELSVLYEDYASSQNQMKEVAMRAFAAYEGGQFTESFKKMKQEKLSDAGMLQRGINGVVYDLTGCELSQVAYYFMAYGHPLYVELPEGAMLVCGIGSDSVSLWNPQNGTIRKESMEKMEELLAKNGQVIYSCMSH